MRAIEEIIVAEYLESYGFMTRSLRTSRPASRRALRDEGVDLYVRNLRHAAGERQPQFWLFSSELPYVGSALVCARGWMGDKAALATMTGGSDILRHLETSVLKKVEAWFDYDLQRELGFDDAPKRLLVAPLFPSQEPYRAQCAAALKDVGVDGVLSFRSLLLDLIDHTDIRRVYGKSPARALLRLLKAYDLVKDSQMQLL